MFAIRRVAVVSVCVAGVVLGWAPAASAHAVLLRTEPSPQTTVPQSPTAIRLEFSEPVETAFGAVRLFDVEGRRVDAPTVRRSEGNRVLSLPVSGLENGTYTVTWRVASADGHAVSGGFDFYVGVPSAISAVPVEADGATSGALRWGFGVVRFVWFAALIALVGMVATRRWVWTPAVRAAGLQRSPATRRFRSAFRVALPTAWVVLAVTAVLWVVFQGAELSGLSIVSAARPDVVGEVLGTSFGRAWAVGLALTLVMLVPVVALVRARPLLGLRPPAWIAVFGTSAVGICIASALSGHARTDAAPALTVPSVAVHLLAVGAWVGGLGALVCLGGPAWRSLSRDDRPQVLARLVPRFSRLAVGALALVLVTGIINTLASLGPLSDLWRVAYGRVVTAKVLLLVVALLVAAGHLFVVPRRLAAAGGGERAVSSFQRSAAAELALLGAVVALAAGLVALVPGRTLAQAAQGPVNQERRVGANTAQLVLDPSAVGPNQVHVTFVDAQGLGAADVATTAVAVGAEGAPLQPVEMRLISPGHFVGDAELPVPGRYQLTVRVGPSATGPSTTFDFRLSDEKGER